MYFLLSGEGITDLGAGSSISLVSEGEEYVPGPMAILADQVVEKRLDYSFLETARLGYVSERGLGDRKSDVKALKKEIRLSGKKHAKETTYFFRNARVLSRIAKEKALELDDKVVAILFRDSDGTASAGRGLWEEKRRSMLDGFFAEGFSAGVPMIPKPKSEAWLICALKRNAYQNCEALEERSGNDNSPKSLKAELKKILGQPVTHELLREKVRQRMVDIEKIKMPSFLTFRTRLEEVI